jgi:peroxiredoxin
VSEAVEAQAAQEGRPDEIGRTGCRPVLGRLTERALPSIALPSTSGEPVDLSSLDRAVLYLYPGNRCSPEDGYDSPVVDEAQHCAFADHWSDFLALNCRVLGMSSQSLDQQSVVVAALGVGQPLLCDADARVGRALGLPTFSVDQIDWYCRAALVVDDGVIVQAFYPLASAVRSPGEAVGWMRRQAWS